MAVDFFLKIDGIPGESHDSKHKDEIDVLSWNWGANNTGTMAGGGGGGAGKVSMHDFHFTMKMNKATPKLMLACATGEHIKKAVMIARKAGKEQQEYMKIVLSDFLVANYQTGGSSEEPIESISINFAKIEMEYKPQDATGKL
jgi:type VI secretion system secreted protein Hcp